MADDQDAALAKFQELTQTDVDLARAYLESCAWSVETAAIKFFEDEYEKEGDPANPSTVPDDYTGPRTLDGRPAPVDEGYSAPTPAAATRDRAQKPKRRTGLATFASLNSNNEDDESSDDELRRRNLFAGGEKSGLAIQDPSRRENGEGASDPRAEGRSIMRRLMEAARSRAHDEDYDNDDNDEDVPGREPASRFTGNAYTLGGEGTESRMIPSGPSQSLPQPRTQEVRQGEIHLWEDGFSVGSGPLHPFSDPANIQMLRMIQQGQAPMGLFDVRPNEPFKLAVTNHQERWRQLPQPREAFSGQGQRLGAHVPGASSSAASAAPASAPAPAASSAAEYDASQPSVAVRVQLPTGARLPARFNLTQTVGDIYAFVVRSDSTVASRAFVISTTFPNKDHTDKTAVLGDTAEFKKGGVAIVKWA